MKGRKKTHLGCRAERKGPKTYEKRRKVKGGEGSATSVKKDEGTLKALNLTVGDWERRKLSERTVHLDGSFISQRKTFISGKGP